MIAAKQAARTTDYLAAMRTLWRDDIASYTGQFANFANVRVNPKPRDRAIPILRPRRT